MVLRVILWAGDKLGHTLRFRFPFGLRLPSLSLFVSEWASAYSNLISYVTRLDVPSVGGTTSTPGSSG